MSRAVVIISGGMDSVTLAHLLHAEGHALHCVSFDYGQRHRKELAYAQRCAQRLGAAYDQIDLSALGALLGGSALTDRQIDVPDGHYAAPNMAVTVVPNRNAIMLTIAYGIAVAERAETVAIGIHAGDHFIYPDCRPQFAQAFDAMQRAAVEGLGHPDLHLHTPFIALAKHDIAAIGARVGVDFRETWSCYKGGPLHCGTCGTCVERKEAFHLAGLADPTEYA